MKKVVPNNKQTLIQTRFWIVIAIFCTMLWGSASSAIKLSYQAFNLDTSNAYNLLLFAGVRFFGAGWLTLLLSRLINHQTPHFHKSMILPSLGIAIMQTGLQYFLFYIGLAVVSSASSAILHASSPLSAVILAAAVGLEVLTGRKLFAILLGLVGIVILNVGSNFEFAFRWNGELLFCFLLPATHWATFSSNTSAGNMNPLH